jgi:anti-sigma B factor antagonist
MSDSNLSVWVGDQFVCIRIAGRASFTSSVDFKTLVNRLWQQGSHRFVLDLTRCTLMDSTFLGILASLGLKFSQNHGPVGVATIELFKPNARITDLLDSLGVAHFFKVLDGAPPATDQLTALEPTSVSTPSDKRVVSQTCLEAHQFLMEINPANVAKFKDVARFLQEDLARMESQTEPPEAPPK